MRHGQTNYNVRGLCNDDPTDNVRLTDLGRRQAEAAAEQLRQMPLRRIIVSELPRTHETAAIINRLRKLPISTHPGINDIRTGCNNWPVKDYQSAIAHDPLHARVSNGESLAEHKQRVLDFLEWLRQQPEDAVLVIAHEETMRVVAAYARGLGDADMLRLTFANCEVLPLELE